jgi:hypothetical protein
MLNTITTVNGVATNPTTATTITPAPGQIWKDGRKEANHRLFVVLDINQQHKSAVCQSLITGKITSARLEHFNRGRTGYSYGGTLATAIKQFNNYITARHQNNGTPPTPIQLLDIFVNEARAQVQILKNEEDKRIAALEAAKAYLNSR